jgi:hypothetical protein
LSSVFLSVYVLSLCIRNEELIVVNKLTYRWFRQIYLVFVLFNRQTSFNVASELKFKLVTHSSVEMTQTEERKTEKLKMYL